MQYLNNLVLDINTKIVTAIVGSHKTHGLVREVLHKNESLHQDLLGNVVYFDDAYDNYFYHKLKSETLIKETSAGLINRYKVLASIDLVVFSRYDSDDFFKRQLLTFTNVDINSVDHDSYKILASEIALKEYDFKNFIYSINYNLTYQLPKC